MQREQVDMYVVALPLAHCVNGDSIDGLDSHAPTPAQLICRLVRVASGEASQKLQLCSLIFAEMNVPRAVLYCHLAPPPSHRITECNHPIKSDDSQWGGGGCGPRLPCSQVSIAGDTH